MICSTIATVLTGVILRKIYLKKKQERAERILKAALEKGRRERRAQSRIRTADLTEDQKCVVCVENPKEVFVYLRFVFKIFTMYKRGVMANAIVFIFFLGHLPSMRPCVFMRRLFCKNNVIVSGVPVKDRYKISCFHIVNYA